VAGQSGLVARDYSRDPRISGTAVAC
jgi:hypothetical protein